MMHGQPRLEPSTLFPMPWPPSDRSNLIYGWPQMEPAFGVVLFADIVGFTTLSEEIDPIEVFALLSGFHREMAPQIARHGATLDDHVGDGAVATWIAPGPEVSLLQSAISCGLAMREAMEELEPRPPRCVACCPHRHRNACRSAGCRRHRTAGAQQARRLRRHGECRQSDRADDPYPRHRSCRFRRSFSDAGDGSARRRTARLVSARSDRSPAGPGPPDQASPRTFHPLRSGNVSKCPTGPARDKWRQKPRMAGTVLRQRRATIRSGKPRRLTCRSSRHHTSVKAARSLAARGALG